MDARNEKQRVRARAYGERSVARGRWGENLAVSFLARRGWVVVGRNVRPCARDRRCEIDAIVRSREHRTIVFVEV